MREWVEPQCQEQKLTSTRFMKCQVCRDSSGRRQKGGWTSAAHTWSPQPSSWVRKEKLWCRKGERRRALFAKLLCWKAEGALERPWCITCWGTSAGVLIWRQEKQTRLLPSLRNLGNTAALHLSYWEAYLAARRRWRRKLSDGKGVGGVRFQIQLSPSLEDFYPRGTLWTQHR